MLPLYPFFPLVSVFCIQIRKKPELVCLMTCAMGSLMEPGAQSEAVMGTKQSVKSLFLTGLTDH